jgi:hypothetical protein
MVRIVCGRFPPLIHSADVKARRIRAPTRLILNIHGHPASRPVPQEARPNPDSETALVLLRARADCTEAPEPVQWSHSHTEVHGMPGAMGTVLMTECQLHCIYGEGIPFAFGVI